MLIPTPKLYEEQFKKAQNLLKYQLTEKIISEMNKGSIDLEFDIPPEMIEGTVRDLLKEFRDKGWKTATSESLQTDTLNRIKFTV